MVRAEDSEGETVLVYWRPAALGPVEQGVDCGGQTNHAGPSLRQPASPQAALRAHRPVQTLPSRPTAPVLSRPRAAKARTQHIRPPDGVTG